MLEVADGDFKDIECVNVLLMHTCEDHPAKRRADFTSLLAQTTVVLPDGR